MSERTEEPERTRTRESGSDVEFDTDVDIDGLLSDAGGSSGTSGNAGSAEPTESAASAETDGTDRGGIRSRLRERREGLFSPRAFAVTLALALAAGFAGSFVPIALVSDFAALLGVFAVAFLVGLVSAKRRYVETGLAGAGAAGVTLVAARLNLVVLTAFGDAVPEIGLIGAGAGLLAGLVGHYFGRDLREGLTADI